MAKKAGAVKIRKKRSPAPVRALSRYEPSPEHKTHPGPWGQPQWHPRSPALSSCPTDLDIADVEQWLSSALDQPACWEIDTDVAVQGDKRFPAYLYWYARDQFFEFQRRQRPGQATLHPVYKGYPSEDSEVPMEVAEGLLRIGLFDEQRYLRWRRAFRRKPGARR
jgi:hypothetical protein